MTPYLHNEYLVSAVIGAACTGSLLTSWVYEGGPRRGWLGLALAGLAGTWCFLNAAMLWTR